MYRIIMKENFMQQIFLKIYILGQQLKKRDMVDHISCIILLLK